MDHDSTTTVRHPEGQVESEDEWEYEYDQTETQDFYITLDLTTHVPPTLSNDRKARLAKTPRNSNKSLANAPGTAHTIAHTLPASNDQIRDTATPPPQPVSADRIQLIDLHGHNPLLSFNNTLYSCQWATDVGTSLFIAPPLAEPDPTHPPLCSNPSFDILGVSSARLIAIPSSINPRKSPLRPSIQPPDPLPDHETFSTPEGDIIRRSKSQAFTIELPSTASAARVNQARFLERLSSIKANRGDQDAVPVTNIKIYRHPEGWEAERDEWIAKETALSSKDRLEAEMRKMTAQQQQQGTDVDLPSSSHLTTSRTEMNDDYVGPGTPTAGAEDLDDEQAPRHDFNHHPLDTPSDAGTISLSSRKRTRGGPRGGAPGRKRLRQSLGLPEARRDKNGGGVERPRRIQLVSEMVDDGEDSGEEDEEGAEAEVEAEEGEREEDEEEEEEEGGEEGEEDALAGSAESMQQVAEEASAPDSRGCRID